ncbi:acyltransferase [Knoellia sinensis KCTC 19936]|uniref:Acyltransferase n=1 Tax=Knoellia sinensis KCTC 19936 TaxID=1385520 RepID=A0A0A0J6L4_9MICO|nr:acyltransferase family protein [Knoellia sinensis]KGN32975.1 acyltransferase [Knoellia sinensis KCTC 19936]
MKSRDAGLDGLRILAILAVVGGHVFVTPLVRHLVYPWHVPVFFFLTGYLWRTHRPIGDEVRSRGSTLLKPYVFWLALLFIPYLVELGAHDELSRSTALEPVHGGRPAIGTYGTFWFVTVLFTSTILWRLLSAATVAGRVVVVAVGVTLGALFGPELASLPLAVGSALPALAFLAAGQVARSSMPKEPKGGIPIALATVAGAAALVAFGVSEPVDIKQGDWGTPVLSTLVAIAISWSLVVIANRTSRAISPRVEAAVTTAALSGLTVVLLHPFLITAWSALGVPRPLTFVTATVTSALVGWAALHTPLSQWVTGAPRRTKRRDATTPSQPHRSQREKVPV